MYSLSCRLRKGFGTMRETRTVKVNGNIVSVDVATNAIDIALSFLHVTSDKPSNNATCGSASPRMVSLRFWNIVMPMVIKATRERAEYEAKMEAERDDLSYHCYHYSMSHGMSLMGTMEMYAYMDASKLKTLASVCARGEALLEAEGFYEA